MSEEEEEEKDIIRIVMNIFNEVFDSFDLPACIGIVDGQSGLVISQNGDCPDIDLFQGQLASLLQAFENLKGRFESSFNETLDLITIEFMGLAFYVDNLQGTPADTDLFLIAQSSSPSLLLKARPFLRSIVQKIEMMFQVSEIEEEP